MRRDPKRRTPRPMSSVMQAVVSDIAPTDPLSRVQTAWPQLAGRQYAGISTPIRLRGDGTIVVRCESGAAASELQLRGPQIKALMAELLGLHCDLAFQGPAGSARPARR